MKGSGAISVTSENKAAKQKRSLMDESHTLGIDLMSFAPMQFAPTQEFLDILEVDRENPEDKVRFWPPSFAWGERLKPFLYICL